MRFITSITNHTKIQLIYFVVLLCITNTIIATSLPFLERTKGPFGGDIRSILIHPNGEIYIGSWHGSIFKSSDSGESWISLKTDFSRVISMGVNKNGDILASTFNGRELFISKDQGVSWSKIPISATLSESSSLASRILIIFLIKKNHI